MLKIDEGIPVPERARSTWAKYPWKEMKVGDSFLIERVNGEVIAIVRDRANKAVQYAKKYGHEYCTRASDEGVRVWRIT